MLWEGFPAFVEISKAKIPKVSEVELIIIKTPNIIQNCEISTSVILYTLISAYRKTNIFHRFSCFVRTDKY